MDWPKTVAGWVGLTVAAFAVFGIGGFAGIWKWMKKPIEDKIAKEQEERARAIDEITNRERGYLTLHKRELKTNIDGVGERCGSLERRAERMEAGQRALEDRMRDSENDRAGLHKDFGELGADVRAFREEQIDMKQAIIAHIQDAKRETLQAIERNSSRIQDLERKVAVIDDRQRRADRSEVE